MKQNLRLRWRLLVSLFVALIMTSSKCHAGAELEGWGDFRGIRIDGELMRFATSIRAISPDQKRIAFTATQMVKDPSWSRDGNRQTCTGSILSDDGRSLRFRETVEDVQNGSAKVDVEVTADADFELGGIYYFINLPAEDYGGASVQFTAGDGSDQPRALSNADVSAQSATAARISCAHRNLDVHFTSAVPVFISKDHFIDTDIATQDGLRLERDQKRDELIALRFLIATGNLAKGQSVRTSFTITASGEVSKRPVEINIDSSKPGPVFDGIGGNFRIWGKADLASADYNLTHLRVPWGRVAMPLAEWTPNEDTDPARAIAGDDRAARDVRQSMEMAKILADKQIPVIVTTWNMPEWSLLPPGPPTPGRPFTIPARRVRPEKQDAVYAAIVSYLQYLKSHYGVEAEYFSLNECDLGIDILQTPQEHVLFIKALGGRLAAAGLRTRMLLADASSPHPIKFIDAAMRDPDLRRYIGALSYHCWHDGTDQEFRLWGEAARTLNIPLFIAEGGTDADSYRYPAIFQEHWYPLYEIDTYVRICGFSQPRSILHWQMTANYSILVGGGASGQPLAPGRRFWQIKQINLTPPGSAALDVKVEGASISACAYQSQGRCIVHIVNSGAARSATIAGLPASAQAIQQFLTDADNGMKELPQTAAAHGSASLMLPKESLVTAICPR